jgi:hypothetical protein
MKRNAQTPILGKDGISISNCHPCHMLGGARKWTNFQVPRVHLRSSDASSAVVPAEPATGQDDGDQANNTCGFFLEARLQILRFAKPGFQMRILCQRASHPGSARAHSDDSRRRLWPIEHSLAVAHAAGVDLAGESASWRLFCRA